MGHWNLAQEQQWCSPAMWYKLVPFISNSSVLWWGTDFTLYTDGVQSFCLLWTNRPFERKLGLSNSEKYLVVRTCLQWITSRVGEWGTHLIFLHGNRRDFEAGGWRGSATGHEHSAKVRESWLSKCRLFMLAQSLFHLWNFKRNF